MTQSGEKAETAYLKNILRLLTGIALGILIYQLALNFATEDCESLQMGLRTKGPMVLGIFMATTAVSALLGLPGAIIATISGLLLGPVTGGALVSTALAVASMTGWAIARVIFTEGVFPAPIEAQLRSHGFEEIMNQKSESGFQWVMTNAISYPLPFPYFAAVLGVKVRHLGILPIIAGIFASSFLYVTAYAVAGGSIGCAVLNHALGLEIHEYRKSIAFSCLLLIAVAKFQSMTLNRRDP